MLKLNFLAGNLFYPSIMHSESSIKEFFIALEKVYKKLSLIIDNNEDILNHLDDQICHASFKRLN